MAIDPIRPSNQTESVVAAASTAAAGSSVEVASPFGPDYRLEDALKPKPIRMGVPFGPESAGTTMASLPPMSPIGAGALTELSIQAMMDSARK